MRDSRVRLHTISAASTDITARLRSLVDAVLKQELLLCRNSQGASQGNRAPGTNQSERPKNWQETSRQVHQPLCGLETNLLSRVHGQIQCFAGRAKGSFNQSARQEACSQSASKGITLAPGEVSACFGKTSITCEQACVFKHWLLLDTSSCHLWQ